jgi:hypothetical protein
MGPPDTAWITSEFPATYVRVIQWCKLAIWRQLVKIDQIWLQLANLLHIPSHSFSAVLFAALPPPCHYWLCFVQPQPAYCHEEAHPIKQEVRKVLCQECCECFDSLGAYPKMRTKSLGAQIFAAFLAFFSKSHKIQSNRKDFIGA